jgi:hypothetical protein
MPSNPNFDDFDLENSSESGIDGLDEIGQTSEESPIYDDGPVFDGDAQNDGDAQDAETPFDGDEATSVSELADEELAEVDGAEVDDVGAAAIPTADEEEEDAKPKRRFPEMTIFEVMLILSFLFITLATIKLFYELNEFGDFPGSYPWRTSDS